MVCASCGWATQASARFCGGCGASLAPRCPACGAESRPNARFCEACGASLAARPAEQAVARKVVSVVFADLIGSTALHERLDPESVSRIMEGYHAAVRAPIEAHGGTVVQLLGDGVMCAFGVPRVAEDDALRAVRAAVAVQQSFRAFLGEHPELASRVGLRVAVNTGEVVVSDDYAAGIGDPLNVAARLQQEAKDGDVLLGESTQRLVADKVTLVRVGSFALKGRAEPVTAYRVVSLERPAGAAATRFVGREDELRRLAALYEAAVGAPAARLAVLLGSPGLGKSRLLEEFAQQLGGGASVLTAQCNPAGGATFAPLAEALRAHLGLEAGAAGEALRSAIDAVVPGDAAERARIAGGIGALLAAAPALPEETFFAVRRLLAALAKERPVVLVIDDLQWADPLLLDFTEHLVQWGAGVPLLVLAAARPELRDVRSSLTTPGGVVSDVVTLTGLDAGAAMRLAASVIGADTLPAAVAGRVLTTSEGNPLFLGELVRMLVNDGALRKDGERWTLAVDLAELEMPPTIQALLAARIERLRPEERLVLERAAVVGRQFSRAAVTHLLPREAHGELDARLEALRRSELIEADAGWLLGEPALRFHHVLIRDAAYRRVLRGTRAELHARLADWLEARSTGDAAPQGETIGWHLEQAHLHLREIGPLDANGRALGERAARDLAAAGRRALARDELTPAANLLGRALACLEAADPARAELALDWCEALLSAGDVGPAAQAIEELGRFTAGSPRLGAWHTCFTSQLAVLADPQALRASASAVAAAAEVLAAAGDVAGEAKAHAVHADALGRLGMIGAQEVALDKALAAARRDRLDRRRANTVLAGAPLAALWGPSPVMRASGRCLDVVRVLRITQGAPAVEAVALRCQAVLETLRGRGKAARRMIASSRRLVEELGITQRLLEADMFAGLIELLDGDAALAERWLREAYEGFRAHGLGVDAARAGALLGRALLAEGRSAEAEALSQRSEALAGDDFKAAIAWRGVRAEALALRGEHAAGVELARSAVEIAAATDDLLDHADARSALAVALRAAGRGDEAHAEEARAIELWEQKGATLLAERARRGVARVASMERAPEARVEHPARRRVRPNAATANAARVEAVTVSRDTDVIESLLADDAATVDHKTGAEFDRSQMVRSWRSFLTAEGFQFTSEPLATLGESLALCRNRSSARGVARGDFDVGAYERDEIVVVEVDRDGRRRRHEIFGPDHLGDAVARLYERYAELAPEPERTRAAATARSVAAVLGAVDVERWATAITPAVAFTDHRPLGLPSFGAAEDFLRLLRSLFEVADDVVHRIDDVVALRSDALVFRCTNLGKARAGGGAFERPLLMLWGFGSDGLATQIETFAEAHVDDALARFDVLALEPTAERPVRRHVRPNAATLHARAVEAAVDARSGDAFEHLISADATSLDHSTGAELDRLQMLRSWRSFLTPDDFRYANEHLATLGDTLVLYRLSASASGVARGDVDVGPYERESIILIEVDAAGRCRRLEIFATRCLDDAIARLYERYAELLPDGPERTQVSAMARFAALMGPFDPERFAPALAPGIEVVDHRTLGTWSGQGAEALLQNLRGWLGLADDITNRPDDILALRADAFLASWTHLGTARASGGAYERPFLMLSMVGADGLVTRWELFDPDRSAEALARFDELTAEPPATLPVRAPLRPNAATKHVARLNAASAARDADALPALLSGGLQIVSHLTGVTLDRQAVMAWWGLFFTDRDAAFRLEPLATLGDSLALCHQSWTGSASTSASFEVGAFEIEMSFVYQVDAEGRAAWVEAFAADRLGDAVIRFYERHAELLPDGPERTRAAATARALAALPLRGPPDPERLASALAPSIEWHDPRAVGFGTLYGVEAVLRAARALLELVEGSVFRVDDILALRSDALLVRWTHSAVDRASGGAIELPRLMLWLFGGDGLVTRWVQFDVDRSAEALARFDELVAVPPAARPIRRRVWANAATAHALRVDAVIAARDVDALPGLFSDAMEADDQTTHTTWDRHAVVSSWRSLALAENPGCHYEPLATLGDSLALCRISLSASRLARGAFDVGGYEKTELHLIETDTGGRRVWTAVFAVEKLGDAVARLYERYAERLPEGSERIRAAAVARSVATLLREPADRWPFARNAEATDHRVVGFGSLHGGDEVRGAIRALLELSDDWAVSLDNVLCLGTDALLVCQTHSGTDRASGGAFERNLCQLWVIGADGRVERWEQFDVERGAEALARFDEITADLSATRPILRRVRPNAATAQAARLDAALAARDADALPVLIAEDAENLEHTTGAAYGRSGLLDHYRRLLRTQDLSFRREPLAALGDSHALFRVSASGAGAAGTSFDVGAFEFDGVELIEVDAWGCARRTESFAADQLGDAVSRLYERYAELLPDDAARSPAETTARLIASLLLDAEPLDAAPTLESLLAPDIEFVDHRRLGLGSVRGVERFMRGVRMGQELESGIVIQVHEIFALRPGASLLRCSMSGTDRSGGGAFERDLLRLWVFAEDGRLGREEWFDPSQEAEALTRFDALTAGPPVRRPVRRVRANAATANGARVDAAVAARDAGAFATLLADEVEVEEHKTGTRHGREGMLFSLHSLLRAEGAVSRHEPLATLGASLSLSRWSTSASGFAGGTVDVGAYEREEIEVLEVDAQGRRRRGDFFPADRLGDAVVLLYERYAELLPDGPARTRAAATARSVAAHAVSFDLDRYTAVYAPAIESVDHRLLGSWSARGAEALLEHYRTLHELADHIVLRDSDILGLLSDAFVVRRTHSGIDRRGGGPYERPYLMLVVFGSDGLMTRIEWFDAERDAEALARFDELTAEPPEPPFANAAWRAKQASDHAMERRDWDALVAGFVPGHDFDDRRSLVRTRVAGEAYFAHLRFLFDARRESSRQLLATRGDRLALLRELLFTSAGRHGGLAEFEMLQVVEVDASGRRAVAVTFDPGALDAAYAELDARYVAGEGAPRARILEAAQRFVSALNARDWAELTRMYAPNFVGEDHSLLRLDELDSRDDPNAMHRALIELAPDAQARIDHVLAVDDRCALGVARWVGSREGGPFEIPRITVMALAPDGRLRAIHTYDLDRLEEARARFAELAAAPPTTWVANAATRSFERAEALWNAHDWERWAALFVPEFRTSDRRKAVLLDLGRDKFLQFQRFTFELTSSQQGFEVLATRGDRLALARLRFEGAERDAGPSEIESLIVAEVNKSGERVAGVRFDPDALDAAYAELDERYGAPGVLRRLLRSLDARDWDGASALLAPELVIEDHRRLGWPTLHGPAAYITALRALVDLAPDARLRFDHLEASGRGALGISMLSGTREGGAFEDARVIVSELDAEGRIRRFDFYDPEQLEEARARFAELAAAPPTTWVENAATRSMERFLAALGSDWESVVAGTAPEARQIDRRRMLQLELDRNQHLEWLRTGFERHSSVSFEVLATRGDRLVLGRVLTVEADESVGPSENESLLIVEVNDRGKRVAMVLFDPDALDAAYQELDERYGPTRVPILLLRHINARDWDAVAALLAPDLVVEDHRRLRLSETLHGPAAYLAALRILVDLAPDAKLRLDHADDSDRGGLGITLLWGTREGGAFEDARVIVSELDAEGRIRRFDFYDPEQLVEARARFDALAASAPPDPLRIPPNAATRAALRWHEAVAAGDFEFVEAFFAPTLLFDDRTRRSLLRGDRELLLANDRLIAASRPRSSITVLATAGDRLALQQVRMVGAFEDAPFEVEFLQIVEIDGEGRLLAAIAFDPDDRRAAHRELLERYARSDAGRWLPPHALELRRALLDHDLARIRAAHPDDFVFDDHRHTGVGRLEGVEAFVTSLVALYEQTPDAIMEPLYYLAVGERGCLTVTRMFGTLAEGGGEFEGIYVRLDLYDGDRVVAVELFEPEDLELARARFEELRPDAARIPANAASRARDRSFETWQARDWGAARALVSDDFVFEDRRKRALLSGGVEMWLKGNEFVREQPGARVDRKLIGTAGDRIALERIVWSGGPTGSPVEREHLRLTEVDAEGRIRAEIIFDLDDRAAAFAEAQVRFVAGEAAAIGGQAPLVAYLCAITRHDWATLRSCLAEDFVISDRRTPGILGTLDRDRWLESMRALADLAPDLDVEVVRILIWNGLGRVQLVRMFGTRDGGPFENAVVSVLLIERDRIQRYELFDLADADRALGRFAELCADRP